MLRVGYLTSQLLGPSLSSLPAALPTIDFNSSHTCLPVLPQICTHFKKIFLNTTYLSIPEVIHIHTCAHKHTHTLACCFSLPFSPFGMLSAMMAGRDCLIFVAESWCLGCCLASSGCSGCLLKENVKRKHNRLTS